MENDSTSSGATSASGCGPLIDACSTPASSSASSSAGRGDGPQGTEATALDDALLAAPHGDLTTSSVPTTFALEPPPVVVDSWGAARPLRRATEAEACSRDAVIDYVAVADWAALLNTPPPPPHLRQPWQQQRWQLGSDAEEWEDHWAERGGSGGGGGGGATAGAAPAAQRARQSLAASLLREGGRSATPGRPRTDHRSPWLYNSPMLWLRVRAHLPATYLRRCQRGRQRGASSIGACPIPSTPVLPVAPAG